MAYNDAMDDVQLDLAEDEELGEEDELDLLDELEGDDDEDDELEGDDDELGWFGSRALKSIARATKKVIKSKLTLAVAGGVALAFPPAAPALPALYAARKICQASESRSTKKRKAAARIVKRTIKLAKSSNPRAKDAVRALKFIKKVKKAQVNKGEKRIVLYVRKDGIVHT